MKSFGAFLRYARKQNNLTQDQVAEKLNIVTPVLSKWENDKAIPPLDLLCKLCNVLNISIEECINSELSDGERQLPPERYDPEKLGETIKDLRIKNGWSQAEVGKKLFVTSQTVSKWESGGISSLEILGKLAELFGMAPTELLNWLERMRALPEKQTTAEQLKKPDRFAIKVTAIILAVIIFLGAVTGLIAGLVVKSKGDDGVQNDGDNTKTEQPDDEQKQPEHVHEWGDWQYDNDKHWRECACGEKSEKGDHTLEDDKCNVCGYEKSDIDETAFCLPVQSKIYRFHGDKYLDDSGSIGEHHGLDFSAEAGDKVYAVADGVIERIYIQPSTNYCFIRIDHGDGLMSAYMGVVPADNLEKGSSVKKGEVIAVVSEVPLFVEDYDGSHLHFIILQNGVIVNPLQFIPYEEKQT